MFSFSRFLKTSFINLLILFLATVFPIFLLIIYPSLNLSISWLLFKIISLKFTHSINLPSLFILIKSELFFKVSNLISYFPWKNNIFTPVYQAVNTFLPFLRLFAITFLPPLVLILSLKPCTFALFLALGWNVLFILSCLYLKTLFNFFLNLRLYIFMFLIASRWKTLNLYIYT